MLTEGMPSRFGRHLRLPDAMRRELRTPLGKTVDEAAFAREVRELDRLVTVGDYCSMKTLDAGVEPKVAVVDLRIKRRPVNHVMNYPFIEKAEVIDVENPPAHISPGVWRALETSFRRPAKFLIRVHGEEDLVTLPAIALAPDGFTIVYGLPGQGAVLVKVDSEAKSRVDDILSRMEVVDGS
ncbi:MAG: DUF359 domain-containing protein [Thermoplasmata archaeon]